MPNDTLTLVDGVLVGHAHDDAGLTGCTVALFPRGAVAAVDARGSAPGTRAPESLDGGKTPEWPAGFGPNWIDVIARTGADHVARAAVRAVRAAEGRGGVARAADRGEKP